MESSHEKNQEVDWSLADGGGYMLGRTASAMCRLNLQHYLWKDSFSFLLHPSIPMTPTSAVADIATGTAIWLIDLARDHPQAKLDGFDVDITQAPHKRWLPSNISMRKWDIFTEPPTDLIGKYDIVHVRVIVLVISAETLPTVVRHLSLLLKPGGHLQRDELNCRDVCVKTVTPSNPKRSALDDTNTSTPGLDHLRAMSWANGRHDWTLTIPQALENQVSFTEVTTYHFNDRDDMRRAIHAQHMLTMEEFAIRLIGEGKAEEGRKFMEVVELAGCEAVSQGAVLNFPRFVCVAKKPI